MIGILIGLHILICIGLIILVLVQRGKGGGLVESFSGIETMFGTKTSAFLTKSTTVLAIAYFVTCLTLTLLSVKQSKSLLGTIKSKPAAVKQEAPKAEEKVLPAAPQAQVPVAPVPQPDKQANTEQKQNAPKTE